MVILDTLCLDIVRKNRQTNDGENAMPTTVIGIGNNYYACVCNRRLKPRPHQQQCRSNIVECYKSNDSFDSVECCFDIVAVFGNNVADFGNNVERNFVEIFVETNCFDFVERTKFYDRPKLVRHCCRFGNKVEFWFDQVERYFDIVADVDRALCLRVEACCSVMWAWICHLYVCRCAALNSFRILRSRMVGLHTEVRTQTVCNETTGNSWKLLTKSQKA